MIPRVFFIIAVALLPASPLMAQNLASIGKEKPISLTGGVSLNQIFYSASGVASRRDPYSYFASGNLNLSIYGWSIPISFAVSNQNTSFQQPFNQYSMHPTYKSITGHFGYTSMSFSPYTVNGHIFLGGGVDVAPEGKWKFSGLYGRFLRAVEKDTAQANSIPAFERMGYGFKVTYGEAAGFIDLSLFHANDDINSIRPIADSLNIFPEENLVMSLGGGKTLLDHFVVKAEFASSAISRDIRAEKSDPSHPLANMGFLYTPRVSSAFYNALKASFDFQKDAYTVGVGYERIDPQYRTLGAYFFNSDLENITLNVTTSIMSGKMNIAGSGGTQRDNIDNNKVSTMRRLVGSLNVNYTPSQKLNLSASYSTFQTFTNIRSQFVDINRADPTGTFRNLDTLNFTQLSRNATLTTMYTFRSTEKKKQNLNVNITYQAAADEQGQVEQNSGNTFYNLNTAYSLNLVPQNVVVSVSFNANVNEGVGFNSKTLGPTLAVNKSFFNRKLRTTLSSSYNSTYQNELQTNTVLNNRLNGSLTVKKKHNMNMGIAFVNRESQDATSTSRSFSEFTGTVGYSYSFGIK
jgi:hypothetical protein